MRCLLPILAVAAVALAPGAAAQAVPIVPKEGPVPVNPLVYPGFSGCFVSPSSTWLVEAPAVYYRVHGEWPKSWAAIVEAGLFMAPLRLFEGNIIDPDDGTDDFVGDMAYVYQGEQTKPLIVDASTMTPQQPNLSEVRDPGRTYAEYYEQQACGEWPEPYPGILDDPDVLKLIAIREMLIRESVWMFVRAHGRLPRTWREFISSDLTPITERSVNPVTGDLFAGDGRPGDFLFEMGGPNVAPITGFFCGRHQDRSHTAGLPTPHPVDNWINIEVIDKNGVSLYRFRP